MAGGDCAKAGATKIDAADRATGSENLIATSSKLLAKLMSASKMVHNGCE
jgi:hypothetical protein